MRNLADDDAWICDDEANLTPEVIRAFARPPARPPTTFGEHMIRLVRVPLGLVLFETLCTIILFIIIYVRFH